MGKIIRKPLIAGNWKMNYGPSAARKFAKEILEPLQQIHSVDRVLCPPSISLAEAHAVVKDSEVQLGAQNMYFEQHGAYTGEISPQMVKEYCTYVILGHSERRGYFGETDEFINRKVFAALESNLIPIVCVGERLEQREAGQVFEVITKQLQKSLSDLSAVGNLESLVIAYEPVWAIGTGRAATGTDAKEVAALIRRVLSDMYGDDISAKTRILYGGSVTASNVAEFLACEDIDGALVGGASLKPEFSDIVQIAEKLKCR